MQLTIHNVEYTFNSHTSSGVLMNIVGIPLNKCTYFLLQCTVNKNKQMKISKSLIFTPENSYTNVPHILFTFKSIIQFGENT